MDINESRSLVASVGEATFNLRHDLNEHGLMRVGKFAGQAPLCVVLHEWADSGAADDEVGDVQGAYGHLYGFVLTPDEAVALGVKQWLAIHENNEGFVTLREYPSLDNYRDAINEACAPDSF